MKKNSKSKANTNSLWVSFPRSSKGEMRRSMILIVKVYLKYHKSLHGQMRGSGRQCLQRKYTTFSGIAQQNSRAEVSLPYSYVHQWLTCVSPRCAFPSVAISTSLRLERNTNFHKELLWFWFSNEWSTSRWTITARAQIDRGIGIKKFGAVRELRWFDIGNRWCYEMVLESSSWWSCNLGGLRAFQDRWTW